MTAAVLFFTFSFGLSIVFGFLYAKSKLLMPRPTYSNLLYVKKNNNIFRVVLLVNLLFGVQFLHHGGVPLLQILSGSDGDAYVGFGIPIFHVLLHTFSCFYAVYVLHHALINKKIRLYIYYFLLLLPHILIFTRGGLMMVAVASVFCYIHTKKRINIKAILGLSVLALIALFFFGFTGNLRTFGGDSYYILSLSDATERFRDSIIPNEFFWTYSYGALPFGSFLYNVNNITPIGGMEGFFRFIDTCILPDFVTNRFMLAPDVTTHPVRLFEYFNVFSVFTDAYVSLGWFGVFLLFSYHTTITFIFLLLLKKCNPKYYVTGKSILLTIIVLNLFVNMWIFSGLAFQLIYPIAGSIIFRKRKKSKNVARTVVNRKGIRVR